MFIVWTVTAIAAIMDIARNRSLGYSNPAADRLWLYLGPAMLIGRYIGPILAIGFILFLFASTAAGGRTGDGLTFAVFLFVILIGLVMTLFQGALLVFFPRANLALGLGSLLARWLAGGFRVSPLIAWCLDFLLGEVSPVLPVVVQSVVLVASAVLIAKSEEAL